mmetsp:Transcript_123290/g.356233  ORF Transcript_123290/g.356233 Transcript_123290/m.356233 type:complete len:226 (-) Transcript_123290:470-1147(-)
MPPLGREAGGEDGLGHVRIRHLRVARKLAQRRMRYDLQLADARSRGQRRRLDRLGHAEVEGAAGDSEADSGPPQVSARHVLLLQDHRRFGARRGADVHDPERPVRERWRWRLLLLRLQGGRLALRVLPPSAVSDARRAEAARLVVHRLELPHPFRAGPATHRRYPRGEQVAHTVLKAIPRPACEVVVLPPPGRRRRVADPDHAYCPYGPRREGRAPHRDCLGPAQ